MFFQQEKSKKILIIEEDREDREDKEDKEDKFLRVTKQWEKQEFIPVDIIENLLNSVLPSNEIVHSYTSEHKIIKVKISDLLSCNFANWDFNRPPDLSRSYDIAKYIYKSRKYYDTILTVKYNNKKKCFDIIDGIHRYEALKIIKEKNCSSLDLLTPGEFGSNNDASWLYDSYILLNIRFNSIESEIIELFLNINKSIPVPDLYVKDITQDSSKEKREIIQNIANDWQYKYKAHFSSNIHPNKPNINRDKFIDFLDNLYEKHNICDKNFEKRKIILENLLEKLNTNILYNLPKKITNNIKEKCLKSGCWLFIYNTDELLKMI